MLGGFRLVVAGLVLALMAAAPPAAAKAWIIAAQESAVLFEFERDGQMGIGRFTRFAGEGTFDPSKPETATLEMRVESASIDVDDALVSNFATTREYFDSDHYPHVTYRLLRLTPQGGNRYLAEGELTVRRFTQVIESVVALEVRSDAAHAAGTLKISRKDFHFGVGPSSIFVDLGPEVAVHFDLTARPAP